MFVVMANPIKSHFQILKPLVHTDLWGPAPVHSVGGHVYFITFVNSFSRFTWIYMLKKKYEALAAFVKFKAMAELQLKAKD